MQHRAQGAAICRQHDMLQGGVISSAAVRTLRDRACFEREWNHVRWQPSSSAISARPVACHVDIDKGRGVGARRTAELLLEFYSVLSLSRNLGEVDVRRSASTCVSADGSIFLPFRTGNRTDSLALGGQARARAPDGRISACVPCNMSHTASQTSWSEYGHLSGTKGLNSSTRPGRSSSWLARVRLAPSPLTRCAVCAERTFCRIVWRPRSAHRWHAPPPWPRSSRPGGSGEYQQQRAVQLKQEQENRKQLIAEKEHVAKARERRLKAQRVEAEKQRAQAEIANQNRQAEEKRQEMLAKVALQEVEVRKRLAGEIMQVDASVQQRKKAIAEKKEQVVLEAAQKLEQKLRRAQSAKSIREVTAMERVKAEAAFREGRETCACTARRWPRSRSGSSTSAATPRRRRAVSAPSRR